MKKRNGAENAIVREVEINDAGALSEIYKYYVDNFPYSFEYIAPSTEEFIKRISDISSKFPFLVCEDNSEILGFAYAHQFKERKAYQWVCETSIYTKNGCIQKGVGSMLYAQLFAAIRRQGFVKAYAVLGCPNEGSEIFHKKMGFSLEATLSNIGYKLGSWHDTKYYVLELNSFYDGMPEPLEYRQISWKNENEKQAYIQNPCATLSTAYWKKNFFPKPKEIQILHISDVAESKDNNDNAVRYFRLIHYPQKSYDTVLPHGYSYHTVDLPKEAPLVADFINRCYPGSCLKTDEIIKWTQFPVFSNDLWVFLREEQSSFPVALGIADFDNDMREGSLEWIQVLPEIRGRGFGQKIVIELLSRLKDSADFITVSGEIDNPTNPESLYRKCGFAGDDVWYVFKNGETK